MKTNEIKEQWLPINANPSYEVSNLGDVRHNYLNGKALVLTPLSNGKKGNYQFVKIDGKKHYIHQLVLTAFVGQKPIGFDCDHKDKNPQNNALSNLRYLSIRENRGKLGEENNLAKLTAEKVKAIRSLYNQNLGLSMKKIGQLFNVSQQTVSAAITRRTWQHI